MKLSFLFTHLLVVCFVATISVKAIPTSGGEEQGVSTSCQPDDIVQGFDSIANDIHGLNSVSKQNVVTSSSPPNLAASEQGLLQLAKDVDATAALLKSFNGILDESSTSSIAQDLQASIGDVREIVATIIRMEDVWTQYGFATAIVTILQNLAPGFSNLYEQLAAHVYANARTTVAAVVLDIICQMDSAVKALQPDACVTNDEYCKTYGTDNNSSPDYSSCPQKPFPTLPNPPPTFSACGESCSNVIKFGYEKGCFKTPSLCIDIEWCSSINNRPFTSCSPNWAPNEWILAQHP